MITKIRKFFTDYEKEENWLNEMVSKGYAFYKYTFLTYHFKPCDPGEYQYRLQLLEHKVTDPESMDYIAFTEELGIETVFTYFNWVYFRKKTADGPFEIHSDLASKIKHHRSIMTLQLVVGLSNLLIGFANLSIGIFTTFNLYFAAISFPVALLVLILSFRNYLKIKKLTLQLNVE